MLRIHLLLALMAGGLLSAAPGPQPFRRPLVFEQNYGQAPDELKWMGQASNYQVLLGSDGASFIIPDKSDLRAISSRPSVPVLRSFQLKYSVVHMKLAGSRPWKDISGADPTGGVSNYLNDKDLKSSLMNIPHYTRVKVAAVYKGIDLVF